MNLPARKTCHPFVLVTIAEMLLIAMSVGTPLEAGLVINRNFTGGTQPGNGAGGGTLSNVFDAAADWWESVILDSHTITVNIGWGTLTGNTAAQTAVSSGAIPFTSATMTFDNDGSTAFFLDATPRDNTEYTAYTNFPADLGGGVLSEGRVFSGATGPAVARFDLFSVVLHELGHALGFVDFPGAGLPMPDPLVIQSPLPHAGTTVQTSASHIDSTAHPNALLVSSVRPSIRRYPSDIDILGTAQHIGFTQVDLVAAAAVPEPSAIYLLGLVGAGWVIGRQLWRPLSE